MSERVLVAVQERDIRCEIHACGNTTEFSIGLDGFRQAYTNVCAECLSDIVEQGGKLLFGEDWTPEYGMNPVVDDGVKVDVKAIPEKTPDNAIPSDPFDGVAEQTSEEISQKEKATDGMIEPIDDENPFEQPTETTEPTETVEPTQVAEVYTCKYCGQTFKKPDERVKYMQHCKVCKAEHGGE